MSKRVYFDYDYDGKRTYKNPMSMMRLANKYRLKKLAK